MKHMAKKKTPAEKSESTLNIKHNITTLSVVIQALENMPHSNYAVGPLLQTYITAFRTLVKVNEEGAEAVMAELDEKDSK